MVNIKTYYKNQKHTLKTYYFIRIYNLWFCGNSFNEPETYLEPYQRSLMELDCENS